MAEGDVKRERQNQSSDGTSDLEMAARDLEIAASDGSELLISPVSLYLSTAYGMTNESLQCLGRFPKNKNTANGCFVKHDQTLK